jgi:hypothetical protein
MNWLFKHQRFSFQVLHRSYIQDVIHIANDRPRGTPDAGQNRPGGWISQRKTDCGQVTSAKPCSEIAKFANPWRYTDPSGSSHL